ncbi:MAG: oxidoreductase [Bacteroidetes bacterium]|nr:oxidoreductase [Bacteroidota bacterium]
MKIFGLAFLLFLSSPLAAQQLTTFTTGTDASLRGICPVSDRIIWASGSKGTVGRSSDGGAHWEFKQIPGYTALDFRSIVAFDLANALVVSAGTPAVILRTMDGGRTWSERYSNTDSAYFLDAAAFWNKNRGVVLGDPVNGHFVLLHTFDGGFTWQQAPQAQCPAAAEGEAAFAASNSSLQALPGGVLWLATGGTQARLWLSTDYGQTWTERPCPMLHGQPGTGTFAMTWRNASQGIITGGDYTNDSLRTDHVFYTVDGGRHWIAPKTPTGGYRSGVCWLNGKTAIATGPKGTDITTNGGKTWRKLSENGYHAAKAARRGKRVFLSGSKGRIAAVK